MLPALWSKTSVEPRRWHVRKLARFNDLRLPKGPDLPSSQQHMVIPPGDVGNRIDFDATVTTDKKGFWYLSGLIEYGSGHYTRFCREFEIQPPTVKERECQDGSVNDAE